MTSSPQHAAPEPCVPPGPGRRGPRVGPGEVPAACAGVAGWAARPHPGRRRAASAPRLVGADLVRPAQPAPAHEAVPHRPATASAALCDTRGPGRFSVRRRADLMPWTPILCATLVA